MMCEVMADFRDFDLHRAQGDLVRVAGILVNAGQQHLGEECIGIADFFGSLARQEEDQLREHERYLVIRAQIDAADERSQKRKTDRRVRKAVAA